MMLSILRYWKPVLGGVLGLFFAITFYLAQSRGAEVKRLRLEITAQEATITAMEAAYHKERERHDFRTKQNKALGRADNTRIEFDDDLRGVYDRLRARQAGRDAR